MKGPPSNHRWMRYGMLLGVVALLGCSSHNASSQPEGERRVQLLATLYVRYGAGPKNPGKAPPNEKAFKEFIHQLSAQELQGLSISNVDELFVSPRDSQPYVINYNLTVPKFGGPGPGAKPGAPPATGMGNPVLVYEKTGSGGMRYVAYATGQVELVDAAKAAELKLK